MFRNHDISFERRTSVDLKCENGKGLAKWRNLDIVTAHIGRKTTRAFRFFYQKFFSFSGRRQKQMIWFRDANVKIIHLMLNFDLNSISTFQMMPWAPIFGHNWQSDINLKIDKVSKIALGNFPIRVHTYTYHFDQKRSRANNTISVFGMQHSFDLYSLSHEKNLIKLATGFRIRAWLL